MVRPRIKTEFLNPFMAELINRYFGATTHAYAKLGPEMPLHVFQRIMRCEPDSATPEEIEEVTQAFSGWMTDNMIFHPDVNPEVTPLYRLLEEVQKLAKEAGVLNKITIQEMGGGDLFFVVD